MITIKKQIYTSPATMVASVEAEGFLCSSIVTLQFSPEVDEMVNTSVETLPVYAGDDY